MLKLYTGWQGCPNTIRDINLIKKRHLKCTVSKHMTYFPITLIPYSTVADCSADALQNYRGKQKTPQSHCAKNFANLLISSTLIYLIFSDVFSISKIIK